MDLLDIAMQIGLSPKRVASTHGGEYVGPCPYCQDGVDRFHIWPNRENKKGVKGVYWCRHCDKSGDLVQFCRDFLGIGYMEACRKIGIEPEVHVMSRSASPTFQPRTPEPPSSLWCQRANDFIQQCHENLLASPYVLSEVVEQRELRKETIHQFRIGWHPETLFVHSESWGIPDEITLERPSIRLSKGIVIPSLIDNTIVRIKIRRSEWSIGDRMPKYDEVPGSQQALAMVGYEPQKPVLIVESELDAMLVHQEAGDLCACLPLGGVSKKPDLLTHDRLRKAHLVLIALDYDEAGKHAFAKFWKNTYPQCEPWPICETKSPGDAFHNGGQLENLGGEGAATLPLDSKRREGDRQKLIVEHRAN